MMKRALALLLLLLGGCHVHLHVAGKYYMDQAEPEPVITVEINDELP